MSQSIEMLIVDDHSLIREGIKQILSIYPEIKIVGEASNGLEAVEFIKTHTCQFILLDINMPVMNGIEAVKNIRFTHPDLKILLLTVENDFHTLKEAINLQVDGYILKESAGTTLINAIRHISSGGNFIDQTLTKYVFHIVQNTSCLQSPPEQNLDDTPFGHLSEREKEILLYMSKGMTNKQIGSKLFLSEKTIRNCVTGLFKKLEVKDRVQATVYALNHNIDALFSNPEEQTKSEATY